ncbi:M23 family metallopeptidase [Puteibacter caeruleilacunae]|nr:M23 family metallopeptidase [Puteibacter caeruleilacunae]
MRNIVVIILCLFCIKASGQGKVKKDYFRSPVNIPILLSGNFAELRTNHFHSGIDIRTNGGTGEPILAAAEGYVSRIRVSPTGFGHALYLIHPEGYTTVYAHLKKFNPVIQKYVREQQYAKESFSVDLAVAKDLLQVKKGDVIAYSGNTGSSGGPHLHFEIRDTKTQHPLNPLSFGFKVKDDIRPKVFGIYLIPQEGNSRIAGRKYKKRYEAVFYDDIYRIKNNPVISVAGSFGVGVHVNDYLNDTWAKCGVYAIELYADDELRYRFTLDEFSFDETRYLNSHIDYAESIRYRRKIHKCFVDPGNKLSIYKDLKDNGVLRFGDGKLHKLKLVMKDVHGNTSVALFSVKDVPVGEFFANGASQHMKYGQYNRVKDVDMMAEFPRDAFYRDFDFEYKRDTSTTYLSDIYHLHNDRIPVHVNYNLEINVKNIPEDIRDKILLAKIDSKTGRAYALDATYKEGKVIANPRSLGAYAVTVDTIAPVIVSQSIKNHKTYIHKNEIHFRIRDEFSGIKSYRGTIDGKWVLFEYDPKRSKLVYFIDKDRLELGKTHNLELRVNDYKDNEAIYKATFYR